MTPDPQWLQKIYANRPKLRTEALAYDAGARAALETARQWLFGGADETFCGPIDSLDFDRDFGTNGRRAEVQP